VEGWGGAGEAIAKPLYDSVPCLSFIQLKLSLSYAPR